MKTVATFIAAGGLGVHDKIPGLAVGLLFLASLSFASRLSGQTAPPSGTATAPAARLTILGDNTAARGDVKAVWGFACLVEAHGHTVLFDTGADPGVLKGNLAALKVDPAKIEAVVISHWHPDHVDGAPGLGRLAGVRVLTPRGIDDFAKLMSAGFKEDSARKIADWLAEETAKLTSAGLEVVAVSQATPLFDGIVVSEPLPFGEVPTDEPDKKSTYAFWEQCLTVDTPDGLVVIVGCAHPGILPMLEQVKRQTGRPLYLVIGGFHLLDQPEAEVRQIATTMQAMGVAYVSATHCTGKTPIRVFRDVFGDRYVNAGAGAVIDLPFVTTATGSAQTPSQPPKPSPEHQKLALWFGEWTYEGENQTTFLGPGGKFTGRMTGRPILDGFGGEYVFVENGPSGETRTVEIDGYDPVAKNYPFIWICGDGSLGQGSFTMNGTVAIWEGTSVANGGRFKDRGTDAVAPDGMSITKHWEISEDGKTWVPSGTFKATKVKTVPVGGTSVEQELIKLEKDWAEAVVKRDLAFLDRILADDYAWTGPDGKVWSKAETLAGLKSGEDAVSSCVTDDFTVRVYGDTALVMGRSTFNETLQGKDISSQDRFTDTWVKRAGRWQCVAMHCSKIVQKSAGLPNGKAEGAAAPVKAFLSEE